MTGGRRISPLRQMLRQRGMDEEAALRRSGISRQTFEVLLGGGVTLPQLALTVGRNLSLTREETRQLGMPLDKEAWKRNKVPFKRVDADPHWYLRLGEKIESVYEMYLDVDALANVLMEKRLDLAAYCRQYPDVYAVNRRMPEGRRKIIERIAEDLGVPMERLEKRTCSKDGCNVRYIIDGSEVESLMREQYISRDELGKRVFCRDGVQGVPARRTQQLWEQIDYEEPVTLLRAQKIAGALGVEVGDIARAKVL